MFSLHPVLEIYPKKYTEEYFQYSWVLFYELKCGLIAEVLGYAKEEKTQIPNWYHSLIKLYLRP